MSSQSLLPFLRYSLISLQKTLEEIIILKDFLEHPEAANASPYIEDQYPAPCEDFKLIACLVQELWSSKALLPNRDAAVRSTQYAAVAVAH
jgi:hypothetical protein